MKIIQGLTLSACLGLSLMLCAQNPQNTPPAPSQPQPGTVPITSQTPMTAGEEPANSGTPADSPQTAGKGKKHKHKKAVSPEHAPATSTTPNQR